MCLVCSYETLASQSKISYFDIINAIRANTNEYIVRLEITVDNIQAIVRSASN